MPLDETRQPDPNGENPTYIFGVLSLGETYTHETTLGGDWETFWQGIHDALSDQIGEQPVDSAFTILNDHVSNIDLMDNTELQSYIITAKTWFVLDKINRLYFTGIPGIEPGGLLDGPG